MSPIAKKNGNEAGSGMAAVVTVKSKVSVEPSPKQVVITSVKDLDEDKPVTQFTDTLGSKSPLTQRKCERRQAQCYQSIRRTLTFVAALKLVVGNETANGLCPGN
jgi:hypothetical protein